MSSAQGIDPQSGKGEQPQQQQQRQQQSGVSKAKDDVELTPISPVNISTNALATEENPESHTNTQQQEQQPEQKAETPPTSPTNTTNTTTLNTSPQAVISPTTKPSTALVDPNPTTTTDADDLSPDQISTHEALLSKIRADLDKVLEEEETKTKTLLERREKFINRMWWICLIGYVITFLIPFLIWILWFHPKEELNDYHYSRSFFDLAIAISVRFVTGILSVLTTRSDEKRITIIHSTGYWVTAIVFTANIAKLMIISWRANNRIVLAVFSMLTSAIMLFLHQKFLPMDEENFDDDDDEKEQAAARKKLHTEALDRADALSRRLTGEALKKHQF